MFAAQFLNELHCIAFFFYFIFYTGSLITAGPRSSRTATGSLSGRRARPSVIPGVRRQELEGIGTRALGSVCVCVCGRRGATQALCQRDNDAIIQPAGPRGLKASYD